MPSFSFPMSEANTKELQASELVLISQGTKDKEFRQTHQSLPMSLSCLQVPSPLATDSTGRLLPEETELTLFRVVRTMDLDLIDS